MKAAIYLRSSPQELEEGHQDLAIQREKCEAMAILKGWDISAVFVDDGHDGLLGEAERPGLAELMDAVHGQEVDVAIVSALDRLAAKIDLTLSLVIQITHYGSAFVSCNEGLDTNTPSGLFVLDIFSALADLEGLSTAVRGDLYGAGNGLYDRERLPLGYFRGIEGPEIDIVNARIVRRIFELSNDGYSLEEIAKWLGFEGIKSPVGEHWTPSRVKGILDDQDKYRGGTVGGGEESWPPIL